MDLLFCVYGINRADREERVVSEFTGAVVVRRGIPEEAAGDRHALLPLLTNVHSTDESIARDL